MSTRVDAIESAIAEYERECTWRTAKASPYTDFKSIRHVRNLSLFDDAVPMPQLVIRWADMLANISTMQSYVNSVGAFLAPHGKTTMAPHIFLEQVRAGSWGLTLATTTQVRAIRRFGFRRVLLANEVRHRGDLDYLMGQLRDDEFELLVVADDYQGVEEWALAAKSAGLNRPVEVLLELGIRSGRTGIRATTSLEHAARAARALRPWVRVVGIFGYEGVAPGASDARRLGSATSFLERMAQVARRVRPDLDVEQPIVSAGGSIYFDRVVAALGQSELPDFQLVLRSGGYVAHDHGLYAYGSPLAARGPRRIDGFGTLQPALELWAMVISRPERRLAIVGFGHRDAPSRTRMPRIIAIRRGEGDVERLSAELPIRRMDDHHAYVDLPEGLVVDVGDLVACGISHPCEAFERWRLLLAIDAAYRVTHGVPTFF